MKSSPPQNSGRKVSPLQKQFEIADGARRCRRKFLRYFPKGFADAKYFSWERDYKWNAREQWRKVLDRKSFRTLLDAGKFHEIAAHAVRIESRTNLLFSFEKMALRDAVKSIEGARSFTEGLYDFLHGREKPETKFMRWVETVAALPRKQTRVLTHPLVTVFGFIAQPATHIFLKPNATRNAAREYEFDLHYKSRPSWETYASLLEFAETIRRDTGDLKPLDMIDLQSFIWVVGSDEYAE